MEKKGSYLKGILFIIASGFGFAVMNLCVTLAGDLPLFQKALFRNAGAMLVSLVMLIRSGDKLSLGKTDLSILLLRALFGSVGLFANFYALDHLLISDASMLNKLAPFFTLIFSALILKEKADWKQYLLVAGAFIGTLFIIKPQGELTESLFASLVGVMGGVGAGIAYTLVRALGKRRMPSSQIVFGFSLVSTLIAIPFVIMDHEPMTVKQVLLLIMASLGATAGQFCITFAYREAPSKKISIFDYCTVVFSAVFGFFFLGQVPDGLAFIGYIIIFLMAYLMFLYNRNRD